jgi:hypothetical protein
MTTNVDNLMRGVTGAVFKAEGSIKDAIFNYDLLVKAEQAIVDHPETAADDKAIAQRGVESAQRILTGLRALWDEAPSKLSDWQLNEALKKIGIEGLHCLIAIDLRTTRSHAKTAQNLNLTQAAVAYRHWKMMETAREAGDLTLARILRDLMDG